MRFRLAAANGAATRTMTAPGERAVRGWIAPLAVAASCLAVVACGGAGDPSEAPRDAATPAPAARATAAPGAATPAAPAPTFPVAEVTAALRTAVEAADSPALAWLAPAERTRLTAFYAPGGFAPRWLDTAGQPSADARAALGLLAGAGAEGLHPPEYRAADLVRAAERLASGRAGTGPAPTSGEDRQAGMDPAATRGVDPRAGTSSAATSGVGAGPAPALPAPLPAELAAFDVELSAATMRYYQQLHAGRVDPRAIGFKMTAPVDEHDFAVLLGAALAEHRVVEKAAELAPPLVLYRALRRMLARYRGIASSWAGSGLALPAPVGATVRPGEPYAASAELRALLVALGDLPAAAPPPPAAVAPTAVPTPAAAPAGASIGASAGTPATAASTAPASGTTPVPAPSPGVAPDASPSAPAAAETPAPAVYDGDLIEGVKRFQLRHGLTGDGVLGKGTQAALAVPLAWRVRQIELALERLRWAPHLDPSRFLAVNIPMYRLWVWNGIPSNGAPAWGMNVIVGRALDHSTPVFVEQMRSVVFRPYWNVPPSILRGEILPALRRDPGYLARQNMEVVAGQGDDAPALAFGPESIDLLAQGKLRVRQRPGPRNALGLLKFVFPNDDNIYLHSTPSQALFSRSRRDFSHGCVRVEEPAKLAAWALEGQEGWTRERVAAAVAGDRQVRVGLARPIQVVLFYVTAAVMPEDGTVHFAEDIYGHDARLDRALVERARKAAAASTAAATLPTSPPAAAAP